MMFFFFFFLSNEGMLSSTTIATEFAQNCQILSKSAQKELALGTLKYYQKLRFLFFSKKNHVYRRCAKACAHYLDFQYNNFL
jgi:hypothetical protein